MNEFDKRLVSLSWVSFFKDLFENSKSYEIDLTNYYSSGKDTIVIKVERNNENMD